jgi:GxxExxY protein
LSLTKKYLNELTYEIIGAAIDVQRIMGRGLLESAYHECMKEELAIRKLNYKTELRIPVMYKGKEINIDFRCDLFVEDCVIVELKAVQEWNKLYEAQLLTYMKLLKVPKGLLINFNSINIFKEGQITRVNEFFKPLPEE